MTGAGAVVCVNENISGAGCAAAFGANPVKADGADGCPKAVFDDAPKLKELAVVAGVAVILLAGVL